MRNKPGGGIVGEELIFLFGMCVRKNRIADIHHWGLWE